MKKLLAAFIALAAFLIIPAAASASNYGFKQGDYVELNGYVFKVLNPSTDYLFYDGYLENRRFSSASDLYDPSNSSNVGYYLNQTFLSNLGEISSFVANKSWEIKDTDNVFKKTVTTKIGLLSASEWGTYKGTVLPNPIYEFWTLTPRGKGGSVIAITTQGYNGVYAPTTSVSVRPSLYLMPGLLKVGTGTKSDPYILSTEEIIKLSDVKNLSLLKTLPAEITISWKNPEESIFSYLNIYKNGELVETNFTGETYTFKELSPSQEYNFTIKAVDSEGEETYGQSIKVSTDDVPLVPEVNNLNANAKHDRVNLSWSNPQSEFFNHVKIYRKVDESEQETTETSFMNLFKPMTAYAAENEDFSPMFETNGTYWNDLTVEPETTYSYKMTTVNIADAESEGTVIQATTLEEPEPELVGGVYTEDENGDFLYTWSQPTTGKVKVLIDGQEYRTVDAELKEILIPKDSMKYDIFDNPKVTLIPISDSGKEGSPIKPPDSSGGVSIGNAKLPFTAKDMVTAGMSLVGLVAAFILLALAFRFVPKVINTIYSSFRSGGSNSSTKEKVTEREPRTRRGG